MAILFFLFFGSIIYTYFGYPLLLAFLTAGRRPDDQSLPASLPRVSVIVSAYNESRVIERKIENCLTLDYPDDRLEIIVVSDGSTDDTPDIVRRYGDRGVKLVALDKQTGKTAAQNEGVARSNGEILVFSDANSIYNDAAISELVKVFTHERVGCVCGELRYKDSGSSVGKSESAYWKYERFCKRHESMLGSLVGVNGAIYALRRECFINLDKEIISDFILPMKIYADGWEVRYTSDAVAYEDPSDTFEHEYSRKKRIILRSFAGLMENAGYLNPFRYGIFAVEIWSHKLIRWFVPFSLIGMLATNFLLLNDLLFNMLFLVQGLFYLLAVIGWRGGETARKIWFVYIPYYFCMINYASLLAIISYFGGKRYTTWRPQR